ncbi:winged helix-turn-helix domain-containing protein [Bradyrhizobium liaoningense]|uniref:winged helix-turn-helix domain-containing protein n=1 Tax=Bradyrhizobium liaoningense TaxID=43992 RepID=UPI001BA95BD2|nr:winged helix-turn-helix domain-containing protein [Bradyrhizobium liaoningense]MBR0719164.1 winged helix-turn-helix domain-containing protein [Bradyrhizobium liaoningense]
MRYLFEDYQLDIDRRELRRGREVVSVTPQVFDLLEYLVNNRERVVSKDDLVNAVWKGRVVSEAALTTRLNVVRKAIGDSGEAQRLIKTLPRKGVRFVGDVREAPGPDNAPVETTSEPSEPALKLPDKPSIAVLPFTNLSSDPEQDYFADGIVDDIITALSHFKLLFVIARNSSFAYKGRAIDVKQIGRELGVRYLLEGSVRKAADRVRITCQLIDAATGAHLWANRFEGDLSDVLTLQDEVAMKVASIMQPALLQAEIERAIRRPTDINAYDSYLRATAHFYTLTREGLASAIELLSRALDIDPRYSAAASLATLCHILNVSMGFSADVKAELNEIERLSQLVLSIDANDADTLASAGWARAFVRKDFVTSTEMVDRAVTLNPNSATAWTYRAMALHAAGQSEEAVRSYQQSIRLSPMDPMLYGMFGGISLALVSLGRFDEALNAARRAVRDNPAFRLGHVCLVAALAHLGRDAEAREAAARLMTREPDLSISKMVRGAQQWRIEAVADGLRKAGFPE